MSYSHSIYNTHSAGKRRDSKVAPSGNYWICPGSNCRFTGRQCRRCHACRPCRCLRFPYIVGSGPGRQVNNGSFWPACQRPPTLAMYLHLDRPRFLELLTTPLLLAECVACDLLSAPHLRCSEALTVSAVSIARHGQRLNGNSLIQWKPRLIRRKSD